MRALSASWEVAPADQARQSEAMRLVDSEDIGILLDRLTAPLADDAYLDESTMADDEESPVVTIAVHDRWVYLTWADDEFYGAPMGDDRSPEAHVHYNPTYFAGTGISRELAIHVPSEWLATGRRPGVVSWTDDEVLVNRWSHSEPQSR
jgi:hypothetical protein